MKNFENPQNINLGDKKRHQFKFNAKEIVPAALRTMFDLQKGSLGAGTLPQWQKVIKFESNIAQQGFWLISNSLI